uniref:hypothetical protein n=1 Tax=Pararhizobium sp. IMCC3301 TaxID=3067904 RepID=UPI0027424D61|nr:hypothetical protein [Pararhizobium sp. IMCC3301]
MTKTIPLRRGDSFEDHSRSSLQLVSIKKAVIRGYEPDDSSEFFLDLRFLKLIVTSGPYQAFAS